MLAAPKGWFWMRGGAEYPVFWTLVLVAIALAGPCAVALQAAGVPA